MALKFLNNGYFAGKVGIGTDSPSSNLDIEDASGVTIDINSSSGDGMFRFQDDGTTKWAIGRDNTQQNFVFSNSAGLASDNVLTLAHSTGNVGIGTNSPSEKLEVDGTIKVVHTDNSYAKYMGQGVFFNRAENYIAPLANNTSTLNIGYNGAKWGNIEINGAFIKFENGPNEFMRIASSGNVGIGTTSPSEKLEVDGNLLINSFKADGVEGGIYFRKGFQGSSSKYNLSILNYDHSGTGTSATDGLSINGFDGVSFCTGSSTRNERMRINSSGNVGIGTDSPNSLLHVYGGAGNDVIARFKTTGTGASDYSEIHIANNNDDELVLGSIGSNYTGSHWAGMRYVYATAGDLGLKAISGDGNVRIYAGSASLERMRINSSGNVGIGTTSPTASALFEVASTTKGVLLPRMNTTQINAISSPAEGLTVYNTVLSTLCFFNGVSWQKVTSTAM